MKLSKKQAAAVLVILISIATTAILSCGILLTHHRVDSEFFTLWRPDFISGCLISIPTGFILNPLIKKLVDHYTCSDDEQNKLTSK